MITFSLDGRTVPAAPGRSLLEICRDEGGFIPSLCALEGLSRPAGCRLCLVEVKGLPRPVPACRTEPWPGMRVVTDTPALRAHRRAVLELLLAGGGHLCAVCPAAGRCELRELARRLGVERLPLAPPRPAPPLDATRPRFLFDPGRCVLCTRCVRACAEQERAGTLSVVGRGDRSRISFDGGVRWGEARSCTDCGRCVAACPTGALVERRTLAPDAGPRAPLPPALAPGRRVRTATLWLGGCSGCHMSLLDLDERLLDLAPRMELAFSPLAGARAFPESVELCLVEGAVSTSAHLDLVRLARSRSRVLVALGDCACAGNVTALRNRMPPAALLRRVYAGAEAGAGPPGPDLPPLLPLAVPVAEVVRVDRHVPGCPPDAGLVGELLAALLDGRAPALAGRLRFG